MKKIFAFAAAAIFALSMNAKEVVFDFSDPASFGYAKAEAGKFTQVETGAVIEKDGVTITVTFASGNGFRFFTNTNTGVANLRGYVGAEFVIAAPSGSKLYSVVPTGSNVTKTYVSGDLANGEWSSAEGAASITSSIIKSTVSFDKLKVVIAAEGETPEIDKPDTVNVAKALEIGNALADNASTDKKYYVEGFAVNVTAYSQEYSNQDFYLADTQGATESDFMVYRATPEKADQPYPVLAGDKVRLYGNIKKYKKDDSTPVQIEIITPSVEFLVEVPGDRSITPAKVDTITTAQALAIAKALATPSASGQSTTDTKTYVVGGYAVQVYDKNSDGTWSFYMADEEGAFGSFMASNATTDADVVVGDYMYVTGKIAKRLTNAGKEQYQIYKGTGAHGTPLVIPVIEVDVAGAMEVGNALADNAQTGDIYRVVGYVAKVSVAFDEDEGVETFFMSDNKDATFGDFQARLVTIASPGAVVGDRVAVTGPILKYVGASGTPTIQIDKGKAEVLSPEGIESITLTEKAQKVIVDGVIYIVRDNKMFNLQGAQVR